MKLTNKQKELYSRQMLIPDIQEEGQEKICAARIAIIGCGALGTVAAELLVRAGVQELLLIDRDTIELSNLQRQALFTEKDIGKNKAEVCKEKLLQINSQVKIETENMHLNAKNILSLKLKEYSLLLDCTDNFQTKLLINDFCAKEKIPWIYAGAIQKEGMLMAITQEEGKENISCLNCALPNNARGETCASAGVLNSTTHIIASMQVTLALKIILGKTVDQGELITFNIWNNDLRKLKAKRRENCPTCQGNFTHLNPEREEERTKRFCSSGNFQILGNKAIDLKELEEKLNKEENITTIYDNTALAIKAKDNSFNLLIFKDGRALIKAKKEKEAQALYSKYVGN